MASDSRIAKPPAAPQDSSDRFCFEDAAFWEGVERETDNPDTRELAEFLAPPRLPPRSRWAAETGLLDLLERLDLLKARSRS